MMVGALTDPFDTVHMGVTAENVATKCGITREQQDAFAVESHRRAVERRSRRPLQVADPADRAQEQEGPDPVRHRRARAQRRDVEGMAKLRAVFAKENGTVTAGNASGSTMRPPPSC